MRRVDHLDSPLTALAFASCEFTGQMIKVDLHTQRVVSTLVLGNGHTTPQDVKLAPDGKIIYVADMNSGGVWEIDHRFRVISFVRTGAGHTVYTRSRNRYFYVWNSSHIGIHLTRVSFETDRVVAKLAGSRLPRQEPGHRRRLCEQSKSPVVDRQLQRQGLHHGCAGPGPASVPRIYGRPGPHGLYVWPGPSRCSLGRTGVARSTPFRRSEAS